MLITVSGALTMTSVLAQIFPDIDGFLFGQDFLSLLASLITAFLTSIANVFFAGFFGGA